MPIGPKLTPDDFSNFSDDELLDAYTAVVGAILDAQGDAFTLALVTCTQHEIAQHVVRKATDDVSRDFPPVVIFTD